jgi:hypothetical protein
MSEFHIVETEFKDEECLVGALQDVGYTPEVNKEQVKLNGYNGRGAQPKAHIVVRKGQFNGYGDAGFERVEGGNFKLHVDDYDYGRNNDKVKVKKVTQMYAARVLEKEIKGRSNFSLTSRKTNKEGEIKIKARVRVFR